MTAAPPTEGERRQAFAFEHGVDLAEVGPCGRCHIELIVRYGDRAHGTLCGTCRDVRMAVVR